MNRLPWCTILIVGLPIFGCSSVRIISPDNRGNAYWQLAYTPCDSVTSDFQGKPIALQLTNGEERSGVLISVSMDSVIWSADNDSSVCAISTQHVDCIEYTDHPVSALAEGAIGLVATATITVAAGGWSPEYDGNKRDDVEYYGRPFAVMFTVAGTAVGAATSGLIYPTRRYEFRPGALKQISEFSK